MCEENEAGWHGPTSQSWRLDLLVVINWICHTKSETNLFFVYQKALKLPFKSDFVTTKLPFKFVDVCCKFTKVFILSKNSIKA